MLPPNVSITHRKMCYEEIYVNLSFNLKIFFNYSFYSILLNLGIIFRLCWKMSSLIWTCVFWKHSQDLELVKWEMFPLSIRNPEGSAFEKGLQRSPLSRPCCFMTVLGTRQCWLALWIFLFYQHNPGKSG